MSYVSSLAAGHHEIAGNLRLEKVPSYFVSVFT